MNHFTVYLKLTQHCKLTILQFFKMMLKSNKVYRNSLAIWWLGLCAFTAEGSDSIPGRGTKIPHAAQGRQNKILNSNSKVYFVWKEKQSNWESRLSRSNCSLCNPHRKVTFSSNNLFGE